jgi:hypothetical protein
VRICAPRRERFDPPSTYAGRELFPPAVELGSGVFDPLLHIFTNLLGPLPGLVEVALHVLAATAGCAAS